MILGNTQPHPEKVPYPIIRPRANAKATFTCLTRSIFGLDTHWGNGCTFHCPGPDACTVCKTGGIARYQGYVMGRGELSGIVAIIHLTAAAAAYVNDICVGEKGLVGLRLQLERECALENSEVKATSQGWDSETEEFPWDTFRDLMYAVYRVNKIGKTCLKDGKRG